MARHRRLSAAFPLSAAALLACGAPGAPAEGGALAADSAATQIAPDSPAARALVQIALIQTCFRKAAGDACAVTVTGRSFTGVCTALPLDGGLACLAPAATCPSCGNGIVEAGEDCDPGAPGGGAGCTALCRVSSCGDGFTNAAAGEQCDDGNSVNTDACPSTCQVAACGDGFVRAGVEQCDPAAPGGPPCSASCMLL